MRYILFIVLFAAAVWVKQLITAAPTGYDHGYLSTQQRTHSLATYCVDKEVCSFMPFQYARSNRLRIQAIQYIGTDVYASYHPELYTRLADVAILDSQRSYPYIFGQHLLPEEDNTTAIQEAIALGEQGLSVLCDAAQISLIEQLSDEEFLAMYYGPAPVVACDSYILPHSLGFNAFYYAKDLPRAITYYRIAALAYDAPETLVNMPAIITARYDDDRKSMMMRESRYQSAQYQLNPELDDTDLFFILSTMEHALRKAVHHAFVSLIQETAISNDCVTSLDCVQDNILAVIATYITQCESEDQVVQNMCKLLSYAQEQGWITRQGIFTYPLDPNTPNYGRREDLQRRDVIPQ